MLAFFTIYDLDYWITFYNNPNTSKTNRKNQFNDDFLASNFKFL